MKSFKSSGIIALLLTSLLIAACGGGGGSSSGEVGTVSMSLTDARSNGFNAVYVTIEDVQVHMQGNDNNDNNEILSHYTSIEKLALILENQTLRMSNILYMNDKKESSRTGIGEKACSIVFCSHLHAINQKAMLCGTFMVVIQKKTK